MFVNLNISRTAIEKDTNNIIFKKHDEFGHLQCAKWFKIICSNPDVIKNKKVQPIWLLQQVLSPNLFPETW